MRYGKLAALVLLLFAGLLATLIVLRPGGGRPIPVLVGPLFLLCPPLALGLSIVGLFRDARGFLTLFTLLISAAFTILLVVTRGDIPCVLSALRF